MANCCFPPRRCGAGFLHPKHQVMSKIVKGITIPWFTLELMDDGKVNLSVLMNGVKYTKELRPGEVDEVRDFFNSIPKRTDSEPPK